MTRLGTSYNSPNDGRHLTTSPLRLCVSVPGSVSFSFSPPVLPTPLYFSLPSPITLSPSLLSPCPFLSSFPRLFLLFVPFSYSVSVNLLLTSVPDPEYSTFPVGAGEISSDGCRKPGTHLFIKFYIRITPVPEKFLTKKKKTTT